MQLVFKGDIRFRSCGNRGQCAVTHDHFFSVRSATHGALSKTAEETSGRDSAWAGRSPARPASCPVLPGLDEEIINAWTVRQIQIIDSPQSTQYTHTWIPSGMACPDRYHQAGSTGPGQLSFCRTCSIILETQFVQRHTHRHVPTGLILRSLPSSLGGALRAPVSLCPGHF